jgi:transcription initiation factor TFIIIB Brf1 subunit/transcription initiation factor TFIIB
MKCFECGSEKITYEEGIKYCKECGVLIEEFRFA